MNRIRRILPLVLVAAVLPAACGSSSASKGPVTITLVTYDSFPTKDSGVNKALTEFTAQSGITVKIVTAGDAGTMVTDRKSVV